MEPQHEVDRVDSLESLERARLRRNQRNSRARKQAYVRDLEERWSECVKLGAQATVEMQREARRVQDENRLLRAILHRYGLDNQAIQLALETEKHSSTIGQAAQLTTQCKTTKGLMQHGVVKSDQSGASSMSHAPSYPATDISSGFWLAMADPIESLNAPSGPRVDQDLSQVLDLQDWINDLCNIKDAFGVHAYNQINEDLQQIDNDYTKLAS